MDVHCRAAEMAAGKNPHHQASGLGRSVLAEGRRERRPASGDKGRAYMVAFRGAIRDQGRARASQLSPADPAVGTTGEVVCDFKKVTHISKT